MKDTPATTTRKGPSRDRMAAFMRAKAARGGGGKSYDYDTLEPVAVSVTIPDGVVQAAESARDGDTVGKATGLRLLSFVNALLYDNYDAQRTDAELAAAIVAEFPNRTIKGNAKSKFQPVATYRTYFNSGTGGLGVGEKLVGEERLVRFG